MELKLTPVKRFNRLLQLEKRDITQVYIYAFFNGLVNLSLPLGIQAIVNLIQGGKTNYFLVCFWFSLVIAGVAFGGIFAIDATKNS